MARLKWMVARVPVSVRTSVRNKLRRMTEMLGWALLDPHEDTPLILTSMAYIFHQATVGTRREIVDEIRDRSARLRLSDDHDDLIAAGELDDLVDDLLSSLTPDRDDEDDGEEALEEADDARSP